MKRLGIVATAVVLAMFAIAVVSGFSAIASAKAVTTETRVIRFGPKVPERVTRKGHCWTESIADPARGAWRCMAGNEIYDPCFSVKGRTDRVVCGADPFQQSKPFLMELTAPLKTAPAESISKSRPNRKPQLEPWLIELGDGTRCGRMTGTLAVIDNEPVAFGCWKPTRKVEAHKGPEIGLLGDFSRGKLWTVTEVVYEFAPSRNGRPPFKLLKRKRVAVKAVWW